MGLIKMEKKMIKSLKKVMVGMLGEKLMISEIEKV